MSRKKQPFREIPANFDFIANERKLLDWWDKTGVVEKYLQKNNSSKKKFSFLDGPITANNPMGVHHAWGRTLKDLYQRYKNMKGFKQRFQNGFDCQGLWVEVEVEKEKGFKTKKDIEDYGIGKFVNDCKARVNKYTKIQTKQSQRLGYFMDWKNSYLTMSDENNYMIWAFLKKCYQEGSLYQGKDVVPWCPRCGTAISQHEIDTEGYKQITHDSVYLRFPVIKKGKLKKDEFLLVWTTTPWTIPANTIVAVSPEINYAQVEFEGKKYWLAKSLIQSTFKKILKPLKILNGRELIEKEAITHYQAPFDNLPVINKIKGKSPDHFHALVLSKELVNEQEGTGLVHVVPGAGTEDYSLVKRELGWDDVIFAVVNEGGYYLKDFGELTGKSAKKNPGLVLNYLKKKKQGYYLFEIRKYTHPYPTCWRCREELIWRLVDEWYIGMDRPRKKDGKTLRERMIKVAKKINWLPGFGLKRELDWLNNMHDWLISKKRYWGLALPIWQCSCGYFEVIGSKEELKEKAVKGWNEFKGNSPHRPWIDKVKISCPKCQKPISRIPDVGNPWLDAGIVSFSTLIDPKTKKVSYLTDKKYWREWYPADFITECFPGQFRNWFYSLIAMSTELEDHRPFKTILGHASVRDEKGEQMHKSLGNAIWFDDAAEKMGVDPMRWLYARQNPEFNLNFGYNIADEVRRQFIFLLWNSYKFFITYANLNQWSPSKTKTKSTNKLDQWILSRLESVKIKVGKNLDDYHHHLAIKEIENFLNDFSLWYIRRSRERVNPKNKNKKDQSACLKTFYYVLENLSLILAPFIPFLTETIWQGLTNSEDSIHLQDWPETKKELINQELEKNMALAREVVSQGHSLRKINQIKVRQPLKSLATPKAKQLKENGLDYRVRDELNVKEIIEEEKTILDLEITPELKEEGEARELIRDVQVLRRKKGLSLTDKVIIYATSWPKKWQKEILLKTGAVEIKEGKALSLRVISAL